MVDPGLLPEVPPPLENRLRRWFFAHGYERGGVLGRVSWAVFSALLVWQSPRARGRRASALIAWARAQRARRQGRWIEVSVGTARIACPPNTAIGPLLAGCGTHEPVEDALIHAVTSSGDRVVDAGAHIGSFGLLLSGRRVTCVEPEPSTARVLRHNVEASGASSLVAVVEAAVGAQDGVAAFTVDRDVQNQLVPAGSSPTAVEVDMTTIDSLVGDDEPVALLKLDLEGFDLEGLRGAAKTIERDRPLILVETNRGGSDVRVHLADLGYVCCWFDWRNRRLLQVPLDWAGNFGFHSNLLAVPIERSAEVVAKVSAFDPVRHWSTDPPRLEVLSSPPLRLS